MKRFFFIPLFLLAALFLSTAPQAQDSKPTAYVIKVDGVISPATYDLITRHLKRAADKNAAVVILEMHTPGGLYDSMQDIIQRILDSKVPVVTYVSPAGSHAASAGTYILYASHIAAMAPGTNIGAATPIQMGGSDAPKEKKDPSIPAKGTAPQSTLESKMVNDASAYIRGLAELRGRNAEWAERAVREAESLTASEALSKKVIEVIADDIPSLLKKIDGRTVKMAGGSTMTLKTKDAAVETFLPDWRHNLLDIITHPNVALLLMTLGMYGLVYEFSNPGVMFPGIVGGIALLLGLFAMNVLPINSAGLALLFGGLALMIAEAFTPTFGVLGIGGLAAFVFGATMLIDSEVPGYGVDLWLIAALGVTSFLVLSILFAMAARAHKKPKTTGQEEILSATGEIVSWSQGAGEVLITGEVWQAETAGDYIFLPGDKVRATEIKGLRLVIIPTKK